MHENIENFMTRSENQQLFSLLIDLTTLTHKKYKAAQLEWLKHIKLYPDQLKSMKEMKTTGFTSH